MTIDMEYTVETENKDREKAREVVAKLRRHLGSTLYCVCDDTLRDALDLLERYAPVGGGR